MKRIDSNTLAMVFVALIGLPTVAMAQDLTADGSDDPSVFLENDGSGSNLSDFQIHNYFGHLLFNVNDDDAGYKTLLVLSPSGTMQIRHADGISDPEFVLVPESGYFWHNGSDADITFGASTLELGGLPVFAPEGVSTKTSGNAVSWDHFTGDVGTSPKTVDLGFGNQVLGATVLLEDPNNAGDFVSIPVDTYNGSLGLSTYYYVTRNNTGNDTVTIVFGGAWSSTDDYKVLAQYEE